jgi:Mrp family chromosome partitioning ATPase
VTTSGVTREVKEALHRGNANVLGVVLNGGRVSREASSGYYAYAGR